MHPFDVVVGDSAGGVLLVFVGLLSVEEEVAEDFGGVAADDDGLGEGGAEEREGFEGEFAWGFLESREGS